MTIYLGQLASLQPSELTCLWSSELTDIFKVEWIDISMVGWLTCLWLAGLTLVSWFLYSFGESFLLIIEGGNWPVYGYHCVG